MPLKNWQVNKVQAVILAGGKGKRLLPLTEKVPKPLVCVAGKPIILRTIETLVSQGIRDIIVCTGYLHEKIEALIGDGSSQGARIRYSKEDAPLGTAGPLGLVSGLEDRFFLIYGDVVFNVDLKKMMDFHVKKKAFATLLVHLTDHPEDSDIVVMDKENKIAGFLHKPSKIDKKDAISSAALYVLDNGIAGLIKKKENSDFIKDIFPKALNIDRRIYGYYSEEYIKDAGTPERLEKIGEDIRKGVVYG